MKSFKHYLYVVLLVLIAIGIVFFVLNPPPRNGELGDWTLMGGHGSLLQAEKPGTLNVLAIDMDASGNLTSESVIKQGDGFLALLEELPEAAQAPGAVPQQPQTLVHASQLMTEFSKSSNPWIVVDDALFNRLILLSFVQEGQRFRRLTLFNAGIRAVYISPAYIKALRESGGRIAPGVVGHVTMSDGSKRSMQLISVPSRYFQNQ